MTLLWEGRVLWSVWRAAVRGGPGGLVASLATGLLTAPPAKALGPPGCSLGELLSLGGDGGLDALGRQSQRPPVEWREEAGVGTDSPWSPIAAALHQQREGPGVRDGVLRAGHAQADVFCKRFLEPSDSASLSL